MWGAYFCMGAYKCDVIVVIKMGAYIHGVLTVGANKKFTFRFRSTVVLQCDRSSSVVRTVYTVSGRSKYLNVYNSCALYPMLFNL